MGRRRHVDPGAMLRGHFLAELEAERRLNPEPPAEARLARPLRIESIGLPRSPGGHLAGGIWLPEAAIALLILGLGFVPLVLTEPSPAASEFAASIASGRAARLESGMRELVDTIFSSMK